MIPKARLKRKHLHIDRISTVFEKIGLAKSHRSFLDQSKTTIYLLNLTDDPRLLERVCLSVKKNFLSCRSQSFKKARKIARGLDELKS